jgi:hypothetical protein
MRRFLYVLFQLDEARRYIEEGRLECLRLSLLLLDNAAEIQMDRQIESELENEELRNRLRKQVLQFKEIDLPENLRDLVKWEPLTRTEKRSIDRFFDEKVTRLLERWPHLDPRLAPALKYLHRSRNEAYHRAKVRSATIRTAALLLLEINCQLILSLSGGGHIYDSGEDYSWIEKRFGVSPMTCMGGEGVHQILDKLRSEMLPTDDAVANILTNHLKSRFDEFESNLDYIIQHSIFADREAALKASQYVAEEETGTIDFERCPFESFKAAYSLRTVEEVKARLSGIKRTADRFEAFQLFSLIETDIEPIENRVQALVEQIDCAIQMAIDISRGK